MVVDLGWVDFQVLRYEIGSGTWPKSSRQPPPWRSGRPCTTCDTDFVSQLTLRISCETRVYRREQFGGWGAFLPVKHRCFTFSLKESTCHLSHYQTVKHQCFTPNPRSQLKTQSRRPLICQAPSPWVDLYFESSLAGCLLLSRQMMEHLKSKSTPSRSVTT